MISVIYCLCALMLSISNVSALPQGGLASSSRTTATSASTTTAFQSANVSTASTAAQSGTASVSTASTVFQSGTANVSTASTASVSTASTVVQSSTASAAEASATVPYASTDPNYPVTNTSEPVRGSLGANVGFLQYSCVHYTHVIKDYGSEQHPYGCSKCRREFPCSYSICRNDLNQAHRTSHKRSWRRVSALSGCQVT